MKIVCHTCEDVVRAVQNNQAFQIEDPWNVKLTTPEDFYFYKPSFPWLSREGRRGLYEFMQIMKIAQEGPKTPHESQIVAQRRLMEGYQNGMDIDKLSIFFNALHKIDLLPENANLEKSSIPLKEFDGFVSKVIKSGFAEETGFLSLIEKRLLLAYRSPQRQKYLKKHLRDLERAPAQRKPPFSMENLLKTEPGQKTKIFLIWNWHEILECSPKIGLCEFSDQACADYISARFRIENFGAVPKGGFPMENIRKMRQRCELIQSPLPRVKECRIKGSIIHVNMGGHEVPHVPCPRQ